MGGAVKVFEADTGQELLSLKGSSGLKGSLGWGSVAFSPDGRRLASASEQTVKIWDTNNDLPWPGRNGNPTPSGPSPGK
jgi:WD40 repeat protein